MLLKCGVGEDSWETRGLQSETKHTVGLISAVKTDGISILFTEQKMGII